MKKTIIFLLSLVCLTTFKAQMPIWSLPDQYYDFQIGQPFSLPTPGNLAYPDGYDGRQATINQQIMTDENGQLKFFMIDQYLYNKNGYLMGVLKDNSPYNPILGGNPNQIGDLLSSEISIVPRPGNCNQYFIVFSSDPLSNPNLYNTQIFYTLLDLNQPNPVQTGELGSLIGFSDNYTTAQNLFLPLTSAEAWGNTSIAISPVKADENYYLFTVGGGLVSRYNVTASGINIDDVGTPDNGDMNFFSIHPVLGVYSPPFSVYRSESELVKTNSGYRLAIYFHESIQSNTPQYPSEERDKLVLVDLDNNGVIVNQNEFIFNYYANYPNPTTFDLHVLGLEFSPDGNYLFASHEIGVHPTLNTGLFRIDWTGVTPNTPEAVTIPAGFTSPSNSYLEAAIDGNIYYADATFLNRISNYNGLINSVIFSHLNQINYNTVTDAQLGGNFYKLPDQIDGQDYSYTPTYACCPSYEAVFESYSAGPGTISWMPGNNPFNNASIVNISQELRILSGTTVNITDMEFYFEQGAQMVIEKGARVISNHSKFTSMACNGIMWQGIQIAGTSTLAQAYYPNTVNGELRLLNNSEVSNAYVGVRLHLLNNGNEDWGTTGGLINAKNSSFINNKKDVEFLTYQFDNKSRFNNCEFITSSALADPTEITAEHVSILQNRQIYFFGCDFKNTTTGLYAHNLRGTGIKSIQAHYKVSYRCLSSGFPPTINCAQKDRSVFEGLYYGINAVNASLGNSVEVKYSDFNEVERGIYFGTVDLAIVANNNFNLKTDLPDVPVGNILFSRTYGLYLHECNGYEVENNIFSISTHATSPLSMGTIVYNSNQNGTKPFVNEIYHDSYNNLDYGIVAFGSNVKYDDVYDVNNVYQYTENSKSGLTFKCNTLNNSKADHIAFSGGVADEIGNCSPHTPANNLFSYNTNRQADIWNYDLNPHFDSDYNFDGDASTDTEPLITNPIGSPMVDPNQCLPTLDLSATCPVDFYGRSRTVKEGKIAEYTDAAEKGKQFLASVDAAVTQAWLDYTSGNMSAGALKNTLEQYTPYISDKDIETIINSTLPPGIAQNILTANSPLTGANLEVLYYSSLPNGVKNKVNNVQTGGKTYREQKDDEIAGNISMAKLYLNSLARDYVHDTTIVDGLDSLKLLLKNSGFEHKECKIASVNITRKEYATAQQTIDSLKLASPVEYDLFCKLSSLLIELEQATEGCYSVVNDPLKMDKLDELVGLNDYSDKYCYRATEIYNKIFDFGYNEPFPDLVKTHGKFEYKEPLDFSSLADDSYSIYPSPVNEMLTIETGTDDKITIKVYDITGKLMMSTQASIITTLNVSDLSAGTYMVHLVYSDGTIKNDRFVKK